jgi:general stress protein 26
MSNISDARHDPIGQIWDKLDKVHAVMLGSPDHRQHMQPMAPQTSREENAIWFYTKTTTDIARAAGGGGGHVHMCIVGDNDWYACLDGHLETMHSVEHAERFWSSITEAWYPGGKNDPELIMLRFTPSTGEIWASTSSTIKFGWEIAKANLTDEEPDVGYKTAVNFRAA